MWCVCDICWIMFVGRPLYVLLSACIGCTLRKDHYRTMRLADLQLIRQLDKPLPPLREQNKNFAQVWFECFARPDNDDKMLEQSFCLIALNYI